MPANTIGELFELALKAETEAHAFYRSLAETFASDALASEFFARMRDDESAHMAHIRSIAESIDPSRMSEPIPKHASALVKNFLLFDSIDALSKVSDLEDAYRFTVNLEFSEINKLHELLVDIFNPGDSEREDSFRELKDHLARVKDFQDASGDTAARRAVRPGA